MGAVEGSVEIAESPDLVFMVCSDFENELRWNPKAQKAVKVTEGPIGVGTRYQAKWRGTPQVEVECLAFDAATRTWTNHNTGPIEVTSTFAVTPTENGCRLTARLQADGHGIGRIFAPVLTKQMRKDIPANLARVKALIEGGTFQTD
jgi:hypothetical protein